MNQAIVFVAWGERHLKQVASCLARSKNINAYSLILVTDEDSNLDELPETSLTVVRATFELNGLLRKTEVLQHLPQTHDAYLLLDSDTVILDDINLGFEMATRFGIAASPAPHYSLDQFWGFDRIMELEGVPRLGQLQYNTGVIFFRLTAQTRAVFARWRDLATRYQSLHTNDQPFFTLAMMQLGFNPYTLSISYNYRGFGEYISGIVRIWHSHSDAPPNLNDFESSWPPRRAWPSVVKPGEPQLPAS
jgi:hypothetical protein